MVGNESILRGDLTPDQLIVYLDRVQSPAQAGVDGRALARSSIRRW